MTKVYIWDCSSEENFEKYISYLEENEKKEAMQKKSLKMRRQYVFSRCLLKYAVFKNGIKYTKILRDANGKPYFESREIYFNISHSEEYIAVALSDRNIGVDVQKIQEKKGISSAVKNKAFTLSEQRLEKKIPPMMMWSIKESVFKYDGTGIFTDMKKNQIVSEKGHYKIKERDNLYINTFFYKDACVSVCGEDSQIEVFICKI